LPSRPPPVPPHDDDADVWIGYAASGRRIENRGIANADILRALEPVDHAGERPLLFALAEGLDLDPVHQ
jgi:hypothetical protein